MLTTPIVAYDFPCSYLGKPRPIQSSLSSSLLGELRPWLDSESSNSTNTTATQPISTNFNDTSALFSCPRRTIDGISSETILESVEDVARLQSQNVSPVGSPSENRSNLDTDSRAANALAVEVWFTPLLQEEETTDERQIPLLPIMSIAEPLASAGDTESATSSTRSDPCKKTQLMIGQRGQFLEVYYRDRYEYLPESYFEFDDDFGFINRQSDARPPQYSCRILRLTQWKLGEENGGEDRTQAVKRLHHIVVAWKKAGSVLQIFGNGNSIVSIDLLSADENIEVNSNSDFMRHWDPTYRLQVFSESPRWLEANGSTKTTSPSTDYNNTDGKALFSGAIHTVALYKQGLDEDIVKILYENGVEKRKDPFKTFFEDPDIPFEPLRLVACPTLPVLEEKELDEDIPTRGVAVAQGSSAIISVGASKASNSTTALWDVLVEILNLPTYGELVYYDETKDPWEEEYFITAAIGDKLLLEEGSLRTNIEYRNLEEDYFSVPKKSYNGTVLSMTELPSESFSYRLIAVKKETMENSSGDSESRPFFLGRSEAIKQELTIFHKNHPPTLVGLPGEAEQPEWQPSGAGARPWATLGSNVVLNDEKDHDIDRVRLDFWANKGTLTIDLNDTEIRAAAEITDCSNPAPTGLRGEWICNGKNDRNMTLLATPTDVSRILSNLKYKAFNWDTSDSIVLRIYDGSGGLCPGDVDHKDTTITDECYSIAAFVEVPSMPRTEGGSSAGSIWRDHRAWWISLVIFLAILSTTCCCAISCWRRLCRIKKLNDIAVSDLGRPSVVLASPEESFPSNLEITEDDRRRAAICTITQRNRKKDESNV